MASPMTVTSRDPKFRINPSRSRSLAASTLTPPVALLSDGILALIRVQSDSSVERCLLRMLTALVDEEGHLIPPLDEVGRVAALARKPLGFSAAVQQDGPAASPAARLDIVEDVTNHPT